MSIARIQHLLSEARQRRVFRVAGLYAVVGWGAVQVATTVFPVLELPGWTEKLVVVLAILGFPVALALAWAFDLRVTVAAPSPSSIPEGTASDTTGVVDVRVKHAPWLRRIAAVLLVAFVAVAGWASWQSRRAAANHHRVSPELVAVLPFDVKADSGERYLRDGMVSLLAARLDGAGGLRSVDSQVLLRSVQAEAVDSDLARQVASRYGAGLFVLGSVVGSGAHIQVAASLYETARHRDPVATASAEGSPDSVLTVVDRLAIQLLSSRAGPDERSAGTAALTTSSLPALRAFLEGERAFREARVGLAVEAYTRAVTLDTTFALAYSRLSNARNWLGDDSMAVWASAAAERHVDRLSPRYRELVEANAAFLRGDPHVESRYRLILTRYPQDAEVWYWLGEVLYHRNWIRGRSATEAQVPFERALALDPGNEMYVGHLRVLACLRDRARDISRLPPPLVLDSLNPIVFSPLTDGTLVALAGQPSERNRVLQRLGSASNEQLFDVETWAVFCTPPEELEAVFALAEQRRQDPDAWALRLQVERIRGRRTAAAHAVFPPQIRSSFTEVWYPAESLLDPLRSPAPGSVQKSQAGLLALDLSQETPRSDREVDLSILRLYDLGLLSASYGDPQAALEYADRLERMHFTSRYQRGYLTIFAAVLRAKVLAPHRSWSGSTSSPGRTRRPRRHSRRNGP